MTDQPPNPEEGNITREFNTRAYIKELAKQLSDGKYEIAHYQSNRTPYVMNRFTGLTVHALDDHTQIHYPSGYGQSVIALTRATHIHVVAEVVSAMTEMLEERRRAPVIPRGSEQF